MVLGCVGQRGHNHLTCSYEFLSRHVDSFQTPRRASDMKTKPLPPLQFSHDLDIYADCYGLCLMREHDFLERVWGPKLRSGLAVGLLESAMFRPIVLPKGQWNQKVRSTVVYVRPVRNEVQNESSEFMYYLRARFLPYHSTNLDKNLQYEVLGYGHILGNAIELKKNNLLHICLWDWGISHSLDTC